jgi:outer membrane scaffolding protein for murein synthesis (MipA/OmpV family)
MKKRSPLIVLLAVCGPAAAENTAGLMMPDGSKDMYLGMAVATRAATADGERRSLVLRPLLQVQWSNGIFLSGIGVAGMHWSATPDVEYGPLLAASNSREPDDSRRLRGTHAVKGSPDVGGFYNYYLGDATRVLSRVAYDTSAHGLRGYVGMQKSWDTLAPHHTVSLTAGVAVANGAVVRELYEVSAGDGGARDYRPAGGVTSMSVELNWNWALSSKWLVSSAVAGTRLGAPVAGSPVVERRNVITWSSGLAYRF